MAQDTLRELHERRNALYKRLRENRNAIAAEMGERHAAGESLGSLARAYGTSDLKTVKRLMGLTAVSKLTIAPTPTLKAFLEVTPVPVQGPEESLHVEAHDVPPECWRHDGHPEEMWSGAATFDADGKYFDAGDIALYREYKERGNSFDD